MSHLAITSRAALQDAVASWRPDVVVSITSPSRTMERPWPGPWASMVFQDREHGGSPSVPMGRGAHGRPMIPHGIPMRPMALPMEAHVRGLLAVMGRHGLVHGEGHGAERLLIHCEAGLGRAPAMSIVAAMGMGMQAHEAVEAVAMAVPEASPNRLVLKHAEVVFGQAIVVHAQYAWLYRRGPAGAEGEAVGLRVVGGGPPHADPPWQDEIPQAARGVAPRSWEAKNGVPTPLGEATGGVAAASTHPNPSGIPHR